MNGWAGFWIGFFFLCVVEEYVGFKLLELEVKNPKYFKQQDKENTTRWKKLKKWFKKHF